MKKEDEDVSSGNYKILSYFLIITYYKLERLKYKKYFATYKKQTMLLEQHIENMEMIFKDSKEKFEDPYDKGEFSQDLIKDFYDHMKKFREDAIPM